MDLGGADLRVGTIGLKLPIPQLPLDFDEGTHLEGAGPFSEPRPNDDPMPFGSHILFAGVLVLPTHVGCEGKPSVGGPVGCEASLCVFAEKPNERDAIVAERFVPPFLVPSVGATETCSQGQGTLCWGRHSGGTDKAESRRPRRAQGFDPEAGTGGAPWAGQRPTRTSFRSSPAVRGPGNRVDGFTEPLFNRVGSPDMELQFSGHGLHLWAPLRGWHENRWEIVSCPFVENA